MARKRSSIRPGAQERVLITRDEASEARPAAWFDVPMRVPVGDTTGKGVFYKRAFNATELHRMASPDGTVMHAEIQIGDSRIMISDEFPEWGVLSAKTIGGAPTTLYIYCEDVDATMKQAIAAGAKETQPAMDQFWGDRSGKVVDPFGYTWGLATHIEDVSPEEMDRRATAWMSEEKK